MRARLRRFSIAQDDGVQSAGEAHCRKRGSRAKCVKERTDLEGNCPEPAQTGSADGSATMTTPPCRQASELGAVDAMHLYRATSPQKITIYILFIGSKGDSTNWDKTYHVPIQNGTFFSKKTAHIGLARDAAERQNFDGCRISIPVRCQLKRQNWGEVFLRG